MVILRKDNNELRYNSIFLLPKQDNPNYYRELIRNAKAFFYGMKRLDLIENLNKIIKVKIENRTGYNIDHVFLNYSNMRFYNHFTKHKHSGAYIYKHQLSRWFDEVEEWILMVVVGLESQIRFLSPPKQWI